MQLYLYAKSRHDFGLENVRRVSALCNILQDCEPILCTPDYRAAEFAKAELGVQKGVGIDLIENLPNIMERGDILIYDDSDEASPTMQEHINMLSRKLYKVGKDIPLDIVDDRYFDQVKSTKEKAIFFSDDDYENWFFNLAIEAKKQNFPLVLGHYFFLGNEDKLVNHFSEIIEEDGYIETIKETKYLLTSSVHTCMESIASGNSPVYFKRYDKVKIDNLDLLAKYNVPVIEEKTLDKIVEKFETIISSYPQLCEMKRCNISNIHEEIKNTLK